MADVELLSSDEESRVVKKVDGRVVNFFNANGGSSSSDNECCTHRSKASLQSRAVGDVDEDDEDTSDDGDFYGKSVQSIFMKRNTKAAFITSCDGSPKAKTARQTVEPPGRSLSKQDTRLATPPDTEGDNTFDSDGDQVDIVVDSRIHNTSGVRTPSPPPDFEPAARSKLPRGLRVRKAISVLEKHKGSISEQISQAVRASIHGGGDSSVPQDSSADVLPERQSMFIFVKHHASTPKFRINMNDTLTSIFAQLAQMDSVPVERIAVYFNDMRVSPAETALTLGLKIGDILECVTLAKEAANQTVCRVPMQSSPIQPLEDDDDTVQVKVQDSSGQRSRTVMAIHKSIPLRVFMQDFATKKGLNLSSLVFSFDGDDISPDSTASNLGIEDGDCIDVSISHQS